jgi:hypothetical protein
MKGIFFQILSCERVLIFKQKNIYISHACVPLIKILSKGVGPGPTLAWPGWKQPDIPVEVDTDRLETSCSKAGVLKKLSLAGIAKLSRLKYR